MKIKLSVLAGLLSLFILFIVFIQPAAPVIIHFPLSSQFNLQKTETNLIWKEDSKQPEISWKTHSLSDKPVYLRQDAALLFENGRLKAALSKWKEDTAAVDMEQAIPIRESARLEALAFHHGEIHTGSDKIESIQAMSADLLYAVKKADGSLSAFKEPAGADETAWEKQLNDRTKQDLLYEWNLLTQHFQIDVTHYQTIPLTELSKYNYEPLHGLNQQQTNDIIGKLWEGLYKNYIIRASASAGSSGNNWMPLVLIDKKNTHLIVLYELNGKKEQLRQRF